MRKPVGARCLVKDIVTTLSLEERAKRAGLSIVVESENRPKSTMGQVIAVGNDPLIQEVVKVGDIVYFASHSGTGHVFEDVEYRMLELQEITMVDDSRDVLQPQRATVNETDGVREIPPSERTA